MHALPPQLQHLIDRGLLSQQDADEVGAFIDELAVAVAQGEVTLAQANALGAMLGVAHAHNAAAVFF